MSKASHTTYPLHRYERTNSIISHFHASQKTKPKNLSRNSTRTSPPKPRKSTGAMPQGDSKRKRTNPKDQSKTSISNRKSDGREGLVMAMSSSLNIPQLSPASHSEFTRNSSLQFTTHLYDQAALHPLAELFHRTQTALQSYEQTTNRLVSRNKEMSRKLALANQQILQLERQIRRSKEL